MGMATNMHILNYFKLFQAETSNNEEYGRAGEQRERIDRVKYSSEVKPSRCSLPGVLRGPEGGGGGSLAATELYVPERSELALWRLNLFVVCCSLVFNSSRFIFQ